MIIIGEQDYTPGILQWMQSKYYKPNEGEITTFKFLDQTYTHTACEGFAFSFIEQNTNETKPIRMKEVFKSLPYNGLCTNIFEINRLSSAIAKDSRRGRGNYIVCNSVKDLEQLDKWESGKDIYKVIETDNVNPHEAVIVFSGPHWVDKPFGMQRNRLYVHPCYLKLMRKVKLP